MYKIKISIQGHQVRNIQDMLADLMQEEYLNDAHCTRFTYHCMAIIVLEQNPCIHSTCHAGVEPAG